MQAQDAWPTGQIRSGWLAKDLDRDSFTYRFTPAQLTALKVCVEACKGRNVPITEIRQHDFSHPELDELFAQIGHKLKWDHGLRLFDGLNVEDYSFDDLKILFWGIGTHFGDATSQNADGELLSELRVRPTRTSMRAQGKPGPLPVHNDRIDILALFCVRKALSGGATVFTSALAIADAIAREHPEYVPIYERGFPLNRFGEQAWGEPDVTSFRMPIFGEIDGLRSFMFSGNSLLHHQQNYAADLLTPEEEKALAFLKEVTYRPEFSIPILLEPGQFILVNNYEVLHSREDFVNPDDPAKTRCFLRLWLEARPYRPKPVAMDAFRNRSGRQGIDYKPLEQPRAQPA